MWRLQSVERIGAVGQKIITDRGAVDSNLISNTAANRSIREDIFCQIPEIVPGEEFGTALPPAYPIEAALASRARTRLPRSQWHGTTSRMEQVQWILGLSIDDCALGDRPALCVGRHHRCRFGDLDSSARVFEPFYRRAANSSGDKRRDVEPRLRLIQFFRTSI
jgi:hypothetical protein